MISLQMAQVSSQIYSAMRPSSWHLLEMILTSSFIPTPIIICLYSRVSSAEVGGFLRLSLSHYSTSLTAERCPSWCSSLRGA